MTTPRKAPPTPMRYRFFLFVFYCFGYIIGSMLVMFMRFLGVEGMFNEFDDDYDMDEYLSRLKENAPNN